jgi:PadR family transcriptional regulator, regulatory protein AphA
MSTPRLSEASYIVLGILEHAQSATPYELKQLAKHTTMHFWTVSHAQLYKESARLANAGLLSEEQEQTGRRRRRYSLTEQGRQALETWRSEPERTDSDRRELRDEGLLKLFLGVDPGKLAGEELQAHEARLRSYEELHAAAAAAVAAAAADEDVPQGPLLALQAGLGHEREYVRFWKTVLDEQAD